jgi:WD40 repeat protein
MARVFISYAREDLAQAQDVHRWLVEVGHEVFLDQDPRDGIAVGERWRQQLHERLRWANAVVCVVTSAYLVSEWCTAEVNMALSHGNRLLPVRAEQAITHALLTSVQHTELTSDRDVARAALVEALRRIDTAGDPGWPEDRSPFPGLCPFDVDLHRVFFGRAQEVDELSGLLRAMAEHAESTALLVVGPSGCGKSSLVRAGLLPTMAGEPGWWMLPPMVPGADPVSALARGLAAAAAQIGLEWTTDYLHAQLDGDGLRKLAEDLLLAAPGGPQCLLVVVDQCEELFTQATSTGRAQFAGLLAAALTGPVQLVATLRSESLDHLLGDPGLSRLRTQVYPVRPLRHEALPAVIEKPARLAGIGVDEQLVARLIEDTDSGEALPLLAFTLAQLADGVSRGGQLPSARYEQLGGVRGALIREADAALTDAIAAGGRSREQVIAGLLRLVTVDEQGHPTRWWSPRAELSAPIPTELDAFVARRLLTTDIDNGTVVIGVAHEAFLSAWPPLAEAITDNVTALRARRAVEHAATEWADHGRSPARLWEGGQLAAAVAETGVQLCADSPSPSGRRGIARWLPQQARTLVTDRVNLSPRARDFLYASIRHDRYRRRRAITVLSVLLVLALVGACVAVIQQRRAQAGERATQEQLRVATARQLAAQASGLLESDPRTALRLGVAAENIYPSGEARNNLFDLLAATRYAGSITGDASSIPEVAFAPNGRIIATTDAADTVILWDRTDSAQPRPLGQPLTTGTSAMASAMAFAPDGRILATGNGVGWIMLWDLADPSQPQPLGQLFDAHTGPVNSVTFSLDGHTLAITGNTVHLWDLTDPAQPQPLGQPFTSDPGSLVSKVVFTPDGRTLASTNTANTVILWDLTDPAQPEPAGQPLTVQTDSYVSEVTIAPDGQSLAVNTADSVMLWDLTDPAQYQSRTVQTGSLFEVAFSPDGRILATVGDDSTVILQDVTDPAQPLPLGQFLTAHTESVSSIVFTPDENTLVTAGLDSRVLLWDLAEPTRPRRLGQPLLAHAGRVLSAAFSPDGRTLATASEDGTVILWNVTDPAQPQPIGQPLSDHNGWVFSVAFSPDGRTLATGSDDGTVVLWDLVDPAQPRRLGQPLTAGSAVVYSVAFTSDGRTLATAGLEGTVILWDLADPAQPRRLSQLRPRIGPVLSVASASEGHTLAAAGDGAVVLWNLADPAQPRQLAQSLTRHSGPVHSVAFPLRGHTLATASEDGTAILWDLTDPARPQPLGQPLTGHNGWVTAVAFTPDGRTLATASDDNRVILWDLTDPVRPHRLGQPLTVQTYGVDSVVFSPDGRILVTAGGDGTAILWDLTILYGLRDDPMQRACSIAGQGLNRDEWAGYIVGLPYQDTCPG